MIHFKQFACTTKNCEKIVEKLMFIPLPASCSESPPYPPPHQKKKSTNVSFRVSVISSKSFVQTSGLYNSLVDFKSISLNEFYVLLWILPYNLQGCLVKSIFIQQCCILLTHFLESY